MGAQNYFTPKTVPEALALAEKHAESFTWLAGGTDVMVNRQQENNTKACLIDITQISELNTISEKDGFIEIGALVTLSNISKNPLLQEHFPALVQAATSVGSPLVRNSATIGGNLLCENRCLFYNQSAFWRDAVNFCLKCGGELCLATGGKKVCFSQFVSDTVPTLISLNAEIETESPDGIMRTPLENIYSDDGIAPHTLPPMALIKRIFIKLQPGTKTVFRKLAQRKSLDYTSLTCAIALNAEKNLRIVLGGVHTGPVLVKGDVNADVKTLIRTAMKSAKTVENDMYSRQYRRKMIGVFIEEGITELLS